MNREQNFVAFFSLLILCVGIGLKTIDAKTNRVDEEIEAEAGGNVTLLCNPLLRTNSTLSSLATNFEWTVSDYNIPIFSNGKLWPYLFEQEVDNSSYVIDNNPPGTLIIRKFEVRKNTFTCTFSTPETKVSYTYDLKVNGNLNPSYDISLDRRNHRIESSKRGDRITLPCGDEKVTATSSGYYWLLRKYKLGTKDVGDVEVISLNRTVLLKNSTKGFQVAENRSLIIESFSPRSGWQNAYECHMSNGLVFEHYTNWYQYNESTGITESRDWTVTNVKKQNISVIYGTRNVVLPCPSTDNINSSYIWFNFVSDLLKSIPNLLFADQKKIAYLAKPSSDFYEINEDGSLVILAVRTYQFGRYVCQRSTGEQYLYDLTKEYKNLSETISIGNRSSITLPCPMEHQIDRDYNIVSWKLSLKHIECFGEIYVRNGKIIPPRSDIPDYVKLADDKTSLIVSNLTLSSIGDEYKCELFSGNTYEYRLTK